MGWVSINLPGVGDDCGWMMGDGLVDEGGWVMGHGLGDDNG